MAASTGYSDAWFRCTETRRRCIKRIGPARSDKVPDYERDGLPDLDLPATIQVKRTFLGIIKWGKL
ncbi:hypothetical protein [Spirosoma humi]